MPTVNHNRLESSIADVWRALMRAKKNADAAGQEGVYNDLSQLIQEVYRIQESLVGKRYKPLPGQLTLYGNVNK